MTVVRISSVTLSVILTSYLSPTVVLVSKVLQARPALLGAGHDGHL